MLVFGIPDESRKSIDYFSGGTSELRRVKASLETKNGKLYTVNCGMYVQKSTGPPPDIVSCEEKIWRISDLIKDEWFLNNLTLVESLERELESSK